MTFIKKSIGRFKELTKGTSGKLLVGFIVIIILFTLTSVYLGVKKENEQKETLAKEQQAKEESDAKEKKENEYIQLLNSGKIYENLTADERKTFSDLTNDWENQDSDFKTKYESQKNTLLKSQVDYTVKELDEVNAEIAQKAEEEKASYDTGITYNQLTRTPDDYKGKKAKFAGKVLQVMEGDKETDLRIAVNDNYDTVLFVGYDPKIISTRILENDNVTVRGSSIGIYSYQSTIGGKISIPGMWIDKIEINS